MKPTSSTICKLAVLLALWGGTPPVVRAEGGHPVTQVPAYLKGYEDLYRQDPHAANLKWFQDAKYGMMVVYGLYSIDGIHSFHQYRKREPVATYAERAKRFKAQKFNAEAICDLAVAAEMKYVTLVTKHCDGFCLWDTKLNDFNSVIGAPARRDLVAEMARACNKRRLGFFVFYEHGFDWRHPDGPRVRDFKYPMTEVPYPTPQASYHYGKDYDLNRYVNYVSDQIEELLTHYGPVAGVWLDGVAVPASGDAKKLHLQELYDRIRKLQPHALISYKHGVTGTESFKAPELGFLKHNLVDPNDRSKPIELCEPLNKSWGYVKSERHEDADWLWSRLVFARSKGMNFLVGVGNLSDGEVYIKDVNTLKEVGRRIRTQGWPKVEMPTTGKETK